MYQVRFLLFEVGPSYRVAFWDNIAPFIFQYSSFDVYGGYVKIHSCNEIVDTISFRSHNFPHNFIPGNAGIKLCDHLLQPKTSRSNKHSQDGPQTARKNQKQAGEPRAARGSQGQPGSARSGQETAGNS